MRRHAKPTAQQPSREAENLVSQSKPPQVTDAVSLQDAKEPEMDSSKVRQVPLSDIRPSPENDELYRPVDPDDTATLELAASICKYGVLEPLVLTLDYRVVSGHRRFTAATLAGLESVPARFEPIRREDDPDGYVCLLREHNRQREKTLSEKMREEVLAIDPDDAYQSLLNQREEASSIEAPAFVIQGKVQRTRSCFTAQLMTVWTVAMVSLTVVGLNSCFESAPRYGQGGASSAHHPWPGLTRTCVAGFNPQTDT